MFACISFTIHNLGVNELFVEHLSVDIYVIFVSLTVYVNNTSNISHICVIVNIQIIGDITITKGNKLPQAIKTQGSVTGVYVTVEDLPIWTVLSNLFIRS